MSWKSILLPGAAIAGLLALAGTMTARSADPAEEQGGKVKIHHTKVYTITDEAARTLKDAEEQAYEVTDHAGTIQAGSNIPSLSRDFYSNELGALKEDVNLMGKEMGRLETLRRDETSWERRTVTNTMPLSEQVVTTADEAIRYVNDNPQKLTLPEYRKITSMLYDRSTALWKALHDSVRLADLREREAQLRKKLRHAKKVSD